MSEEAQTEEIPDSTRDLEIDDEKEIMKWPTSVVPYQCAIIPLIDKKDKSNLIVC